MFSELGRTLVRIDNERDMWATDDAVAPIRNIQIRNLDVWGDDMPPITIKGRLAGPPIEGVAFEAVAFNGRLVEEATLAARMKLSHVQNVRLTTETESQG